jgi:hypothetical protein
MSPTKMEVVNAGAARPGKPAARPFTVVAPASADDVMREQLDFLIEHASSGECGCSVCQRYSRARSVLLDLFQVESH